MVQLISEISSFFSESIKKYYYFNQLVGTLNSSIESKINQNIEPLEAKLKNISNLVKNLQSNSLNELVLKIDHINYSDEKEAYINWRYTIWSSLLIKSYGEFEKCFDELCRFVKGKKQIALLPSDLKDKGIFRSKKYLEAVANIKLSSNKNKWEEFKIINDIRNSIVHNNGVLDKKQNIFKHIIDNPALEITTHDQILISVEYLKNSYTLLHNLLLTTYEDVNDDLISFFHASLKLWPLSHYLDELFSQTFWGHMWVFSLSNFIKVKLTGLKTKKEVVEEGLKTLISIRKQAKLKSLRGKLKWEGDIEKMRED